MWTPRVGAQSWGPGRELGAKAPGSSLGPKAWTPAPAPAPQTPGSEPGLRAQPTGAKARSLRSPTEPYEAGGSIFCEGLRIELDLV